eukprot:1157939-Pelagomonas_calceolata.AAC.2
MPPPHPCRGWLQSVTAGANPINVKKGIDKACDYLVEQLKEVAKPIKGRKDIKVCVTDASSESQASCVTDAVGWSDVASISAGNDEFIGEMIADALDKVGSNGVLSIESSNRCEAFQNTLCSASKVSGEPGCL